MYQYLLDRWPLFLVFLSGIGFSIQTLFIKLLAERGFQGSFQLVFARGFCQFFLSIIFIYFDADRRAGKGPSLFGDTNWVRWIVLLRGVIGYLGIAFAFLSAELIPMGDSTVLVMLSPLIASIAGFFILGEPWRLPEFFATVVSLVGAVLVAKPPFIFGSEGDGGGEDRSASDTSLGIMYGLIAAFGAGFAYVTIRMLGTTCKMPWANVCLAQALCQIILSVPSLYLAGQHITVDLTFVEFFLIFGGGFIGGWSQIAMTIGMQREKSSLATGMRMSDVVFGFIWQACFTSDAVSVLSVTGALLVTSSIIIMAAFKQSPAPVPAPASSLDDSTHDASKIEIVEGKRQAMFSIEDTSDEDDDIEMTIRNPISSGRSSSPLPLDSSLKKIQIGTILDESSKDANPGERKTLKERLQAVNRIIRTRLRPRSGSSDSHGGEVADSSHKYSTLAQTEFRI